MRPTKLNQLVIDTFKAVLEEEYNAIVCTDYELWFLMNERLPEESRVCYRSFQRYKAQALEKKELELDPEDYDLRLSNRERNTGITINEKIEKIKKFREEEDKIEAETGKEALLGSLYKLWQLTIIKQKNRLFKMLLEADKNWARIKWVFERKFRDFSDVYLRELDERRIRNWRKYSGY